MKFKYRVKGKIKISFILRGTYFSNGNNLDLCICANELDFIKTHCDISELVDFEEKSKSTPKPVLDTKIDTKPKEVVENGDKQQKANRTNKRNDTIKV